MHYYPVQRFPIKKDLLPFLSYLRANQIECHVTEEEGKQQLWINNEQAVGEVSHIANLWLNGDLELVTQPKGDIDTPSLFANNWRIVLEYPISILFIILGISGYILSFNHDIIELFLYQPIQGNRFLPLSHVLDTGQYWRLITPIFIHWSSIHILFNAVVLWGIGCRIEKAKGPWFYLSALLAIGLVSNTAQYFSHINTPFGGLSGVVYGVVGYLAVYQTFIQHPVLQYNRAVIAMLIIWLVLGFTGIIDLLIEGSIANMAHLAGLISGAVIAVLSVVIDRSKNIDINSQTK